MDSGDVELLKRVTENLLHGKRIFLSGAAGTGKTYLVKKIAKQIAAEQKVVYITASTGIAASLLFDEIGSRKSFFVKGPSTLHAAAMLPWTSEDDRQQLREAGMRRLRGTNVVIIDEISMLDSLTFDRFLKRIDHNTGLLVVGDFFQLPPIHTDAENGPDFAFKSPAFRDFELVELTKVYRQDDVDFLRFLERLRHGQNILPFYLDVSREFDLKHPVLFGTNLEAGGHNKKEMAKLKAKAYFSQCRVRIGNHEKALKWFDNYTRALQKLEMKKAMRVLCIQNHHKLVNGDLGTIVKIGKEYPEKEGPMWLDVEFDRVGIGKQRIFPYRFEKRVWHNDRHQVKFVVEQFPLIPAYGLTVHKAQGMSLDIVNIDGSRINFAGGQVYVAISRCRTKSGLRIMNANKFNAFDRDTVERYYQNAKRLQIKAEEASTNQKQEILPKDAVR